jgi:hypothetical protein
MMSNVSDLSSIIGFGTTGAATAAAIYAGAAAINKDASKTAKQDIAKFLRGWRGSFDVSLIAKHISQVFGIIFGDRQISIKCISRSVLASALFFSVVFVILEFEGMGPLAPPMLVSLGREGAMQVIVILVAMSFCFIPDFISVWKSRLVLKLVQRRHTFRYIAIIWSVDVLLSFVIFYLFLGALVYLFNPADLWSGAKDIPHATLVGFAMLFGRSPGSEEADMLVPLMMTSTLLTSVWTLGVLISALLARALMALKYPLRLLTWLYDVEENAIKIVGLMLAGLTWALFVVYSLI